MISVFLCPSDGQTLPSTGGLRQNNYHGSIGTSTDTWNANSSGVFAHARAYPISTVRDGTSNTVMYSEALTGEGAAGIKIKGRTGTGITNTAGRAVNPIVVSGNTLALSANAMAELTACATAWNTGTPLGSNRGSYWAVGSPGFTLFNTLITPNSTQYPWTSCRTDNGSAGSDYGDFLNANSNHAGGVNTAMCDGSVKFIKDSIAQNVWWGLGTKAGSETISADAY
jgi:prepilin-type processing-associated H-X9-DG protein